MEMLNIKVYVFYGHKYFNIQKVVRFYLSDTPQVKISILDKEANYNYHMPIFIKE